MSGGAEAGQEPPRVPGTRARSPLSAAGKLSICQTSKPCFSVGLSPHPPFYARLLSLAKSRAAAVRDAGGTLPTNV